MILGQAGYAVQAEADPEAAIRFARSAPRLDLVVTDVVLPGMNGRVMAEALAEIHPRVRVLYISGYTEDEVLRGRALQEGFPFLQKPFLPNVLARRVREILDSR